MKLNIFLIFLILLSSNVFSMSANTRVGTETKEVLVAKYNINESLIIALGEERSTIEENTKKFVKDNKINCDSLLGRFVLANPLIDISHFEDYESLVRVILNLFYHDLKVFQYAKCLSSELVAQVLSKQENRLSRKELIKSNLDNTNALTLVKVKSNIGVKYKISGNREENRSEKIKWQASVSCVEKMGIYKSHQTKITSDREHKTDAKYRFVEAEVIADCEIPNELILAHHLNIDTLFYLTSLIDLKANAEDLKRIIDCKKALEVKRPIKFGVFSLHETLSTEICRNAYKTQTLTVLEDLVQTFRTQSQNMERYEAIEFLKINQFLKYHNYLNVNQ